MQKKSILIEYTVIQNMYLYYVQFMKTRIHITCIARENNLHCLHINLLCYVFLLVIVLCDY